MILEKYGRAQCSLFPTTNAHYRCAVLRGPIDAFRAHYPQGTPNIMLYDDYATSFCTARGGGEGVQAVEVVAFVFPLLCDYLYRRQGTASGRQFAVGNLPTSSWHLTIGCVHLNT